MGIFMKTKNGVGSALAALTAGKFVYSKQQFMGC